MEQSKSMFAGMHIILLTSYRAYSLSKYFSKDPEVKWCQPPSLELKIIIDKPIGEVKWKHENKNEV